MLAIALALGSSACYGISNFIGPQLARRHAIVSVLVISQVAALIGCAAYWPETAVPRCPPRACSWLCSRARAMRSA